MTFPMSFVSCNRKANYQPPQPTILFKSNRHHRGSIYCVAWSTTGDIIATGSNDKSIKMTRFDAETCSIIWPGLDLAIHGGTVRDLAFVSRASGSPVLVSGGAGSSHTVRIFDLQPPVIYLLSLLFLFFNLGSSRWKGEGRGPGHWNSSLYFSVTYTLFVQTRVCMHLENPLEL